MATQRSNEEHFKTNKTPNEITVYLGPTNKYMSHVTKAAGI